MGVLTVCPKTWEETQADVEKLFHDLGEHESTAQLDEDNRRQLAKLGESLNMPAYHLLRFLVVMGAVYVYTLDEKTLNVLRAALQGDVNVRGPAYELPF